VALAVLLSGAATAYAAEPSDICPVSKTVDTEEASYWYSQDGMLIGEVEAFFSMGDVPIDEDAISINDDGSLTYNGKQFMPCP
jgi:hypothetical protein